ncbi:Clp protease N-terminal domain-containing protein [Streptomyces sp. NRRL S-87]|uniref:Clp protease N-terminal domain-containing protein n=1 Tax=Streptomyces sp. NRRL S-87 TaxID=1463920 RepID=UPI0004BF7497|nr:Clp protease N-terminal domain-containing protein [Streptomyces sp. NRRL S-87]
MFERFTREARDVVTGAVGHAERAAAERVTEEHVLLALTDRPPFTALGVRPEAVAESLAEARRRGGLSKVDQEALASLGIDLGEVVSRIEEAHGVGALDGGPARRRSGRPRFTPGAKKVLEQSLRIALGRRDRHIGTEHLLLALLTRPGSTAEVLADLGVTYARVEAALAPPRAS